MIPVSSLATSQVMEPLLDTMGLRGANFMDCGKVLFIGKCLCPTPYTPCLSPIPILPLPPIYTVPSLVSTHIYLFSLTFSLGPDEATTVWWLQKLVCDINA